MSCQLQWSYSDQQAAGDDFKIFSMASACHAQNLLYGGHSRPSQFLRGIFEAFYSYKNVILFQSLPKFFLDTQFTPDLHKAY